MAKDPAFLFYSQDFFTGVASMTFEDRGKYITLISLMHQQGRMNEETIRFIVGSISDNLKSKFRIDENGYWYNVRLEEEIEKRKNFVDSRRNNGKKGGRPSNKKPLGYPNGKATTNLLEDENENEFINIDSTIEGHSDFAKKLLSDKMKYDKEQIEVATRKLISTDILRKFNAQLFASDIKHRNINEYKKHLMNWLRKQPETQTKKLQKLD